MEHLGAIIKKHADLKEAIDGAMSSPVDGDVKAVLVATRDAVIASMKRLLLCKSREEKLSLLSSLTAGLDAPQKSFVEHLKPFDLELLAEIVKVSGINVGEVVDSVVKHIDEVRNLLTPAGALLIFIDKYRIAVDVNKLMNVKQE